MKKAYMVIGCPGSGKSYVCDQLKDLFHYVHHDLYIGMAGGTYVQEILKASEQAKKPLLIEAPFSISQIKDPLEQFGFEITPVFIQEPSAVIADRYRKRENKEIPKGHLTRQETYRERAHEWKAFQGTSSQVLEHLKKAAAGELTVPAQAAAPQGSGPWAAVEGALTTPPGDDNAVLAPLPGPPTVSGSGST